MDLHTAVIVAGHGSLRNTGARRPICAAVQALRATGAYSEVRCALWKEDPPFAGALDRVSSSRVVVLPYFMAAGYYTDVVLPREMRLDGPLTRRAGRSVVVAEPLGTDARLAGIILERAREAGFDGSQSLAVLGHGTERSPASARTTFEQVDRLHGAAPFVFPVFIDQEPRVTRIFDLCPGGDIILVPYFPADGWHVSETLPADLGLQEGGIRREGRLLRVSAAAGSSPSILPMVLDRVQAASRLL